MICVISFLLPETDKMRASNILAVTVSIIAAARGSPPRKPDLPDILEPDARSVYNPPWSFPIGYFDKEPTSPILAPNSGGLDCVSPVSHLCSNAPLPQRDHYPYNLPAQLGMGDNCWSTCGGKGGKCEACPAVEKLLYDPDEHPFIHVQPGRCCRQLWDDNDPACYAVGCHWYHCCA